MKHRRILIRPSWDIARDCEIVCQMKLLIDLFFFVNGLRVFIPGFKTKMEKKTNAFERPPTTDLE